MQGKVNRKPANEIAVAAGCLKHLAGSSFAIVLLMLLAGGGSSVAQTPTPAPAAVAPAAVPATSPSTSPATTQAKPSAAKTAQPATAPVPKAALPSGATLHQPLRSSQNTPSKTRSPASPDREGVSHPDGAAIRTTSNGRAPYSGAGTGPTAPTTPSLPPPPEQPTQRTRIKDVATIEGIRDNQLIGYGLVVGLRGTGDTQQTVFPIQTLISTLERLGITVPQTGNNSASNMQVKNMAAVFVVATLPPFSRPGGKLDITLSSAGDSKSLEGGLLLMTPLYGPDGQIYAQAQGPLVLGGYQISGGANSKAVNHPTTARVPGGALVERTVPFDLKQMHIVSVMLNDADFHTAEQMAGAINHTLRIDRAHAVDSRRVDLVAIPDEDLPALLDRIEAVEIDVFPRARVIVNERTGTVVIGGKVRLQPVSILHGGLSVNVITETKVSQPNALAQGTTQVVQQTTLQATDKPVNRIELREGATVEDLVQELQQIGATARDVISILQGMKEAGALEADLEVL